jgi:SAM-dependent methyltransferase
MNDAATDAATDAGRFYAKAAKERAGRTSCCGSVAPTLAAGYEQEGLDQAPQEAVEASFGCGDPVAFADVQPGQTVLDLGCGAGLDLIIAAGKVGTTGKIIGVDASEDMLPLAQANIERAGVGAQVELRQGMIEELPVESHSVDWVISNCVVNLSTDKPQVFREIRRVLKPGGSAVIADLVAENLPDWVSAHTDLYSACVSGAVSEQRYLELAREAGFEEAKVTARMDYDESMVRGVISDALPIDIDEIAGRLAMSREDFLDMACRDLAGSLSSVRFSFSTAA